MEPLPRIRALEILRLPDDGETVSYLLRDPEGYSDEELVLSEAAHADGRHTRKDLERNFRERYGTTPGAGEIDSLLARLEAAHMLESAGFEAHRRGLHEVFHAAPARPASHAGTCYPAGPEDAAAVLRRYRENAVDLEEDGPRPEGRLRGVVAPHIDLRVGGPATALAYRLLEESPGIETVVVLGTAHGCPHPSWAVLEKPYETPLGPVPVDAEAARRLAGAAGASPDDLFLHRKEHSVEFQAVFLADLRRTTGRDLRMVPVLCGSLRTLGGELEDPGGAPPDRRGTAGVPEDPPDPAADPFLAELIALLEESGEKAVVVAGADLAHVGVRFGDAEPLSERHLELLEEKDRRTLERVTGGDPSGFFRSVMEAGDPRRICGLAPIYAALAALDGVRGKVLRYEQATDASGTVSYATVGLWG